MKSLKNLLPKVKKNDDALVLEMIKKLLGGGSTVNITINNYVADKLKKEKKEKKFQDEGQSVLEPAPSVKAENFIK